MRECDYQDAKSICRERLWRVDGRVYGQLRVTGCETAESGMRWYDMRAMLDSRCDNARLSSFQEGRVSYKE
jgi:hypothetical protein